MNDYILSPRQHEIATLLAQDISSREIARRLCISPQTVKTTLAVVEERLGVRSYVGIAVVMVTKLVRVEDGRAHALAGLARAPYGKGYGR